ncbi:hypothetical protein ACHAPT_010913 [Fusarium lateritium]
MPGSVSTGTVQNQVIGGQHVYGDQIFNAPSNNAKALLRDCLQSLAYPNMNDRSNAIEIPTGGTCEWLLRHRQWKRWRSCQHGLLWIKGKPGSGKSTLLRYALHELKSTKGAMMLSFFFHGRGHDLQRNPLGLFRSLVHQVLSEMPGALSQLVATFEQRRDSIGRVGEGWVWELDELHKFFKWSILEVLKSRPVWIFVDALDECGAENARAVIRHFKDLLHGPSSRLEELHICFTCRHYPVQNWAGGFEICAEHENKQDISTYVQTQLANFQCPATLALSDLITGRSNGLFIWACIVVDQVLDLELPEDSTKADELINKTINTIPQDLGSLYVELFRGVEETPTSLKLVQWVSCARRPLSLDELRWAMAVDPSLPHTSLKDYENTPAYTKDNDLMERKVKTLGRGLVETVASSDGRIVQFIHQSVKEFFDTRTPKTAEEDSGCMSYSATEAAYYQLYRTCIHYLAMKEFVHLPQLNPLAYSRWYQLTTLPLFVDPTLAYRKYHQKLELDRFTFLSDYPLLDYATTSWITHLQESQQSIQGERGCRRFNWPSDTVLEQ